LLIRRLIEFRETGVVCALFVVFIAVSIIEPRFWSLDTLRMIAITVPLILVAAVGQMAVIVSRHVDLSIGSIMAFSAIVGGMIFRDYPDLPVVVGVLAALAAGALLGLFNGLLVTKFHLPSIIVTLATLSFFRGLVFLLSGGRQIDPNHIPEEIVALSQASFLGLPWIVIIALAVTLLVYVLLHHLQIGRQIYAAGSAPESARLRGVPIDRVTVFVFVLSGFVSGLCGILYASRFGYVNPGITGVGFEFVVIAAVIIGGVSINGGVGTLTGVLLGVLLLGTVSVALPVIGVSGFWQSAIYGAIILVALIIDRTVRLVATGRASPLRWRT
jgi:rhamnose transport system permease protein